MKKNRIIQFKLDKKCSPGHYGGSDQKVTTAYITLDNFINVCKANPIPERVNPRTHNSKKALRGETPRNIKKTLQESPESFAIRNGGITMTAKSVKIEKDIINIDIGNLSDINKYGAFNGMTTVATLLELDKANPNFSKKNEPTIDFSAGAIKCEIITGIVDRNDIGKLAVARNSVKAVNPISISNFNGNFDWLKRLIKSEPYYKNIGFEENSDCKYNINHIAAILSLFSPYWAEEEKQPGIAYRGKQKLVKLFTTPTTEKEDKEQRYFQMLAPLVKDIFRLFDTIIADFGDVYEGKIKKLKLSENTRFKCFKKNRSISKSFFTGRPFKYKIPKTVWCPLVSCMRVLVEIDGVNTKWKHDPFVFWNSNKDKFITKIMILLGNYDSKAGDFGRNDDPFKEMYITALKALSK